MKRRLLILLLIPTIFVQAEVQEKIAIVVNNRAVTLYELKKVYQARSTELFQQFSGDELQRKLAELKETVIKEKTDDLLLLEKADLEGITITDEQMDRFMQDLMTENNIDNKEQFENLLIQSVGMTLPEFRESQRAQHVARTVIRQHVIARITADEPEVRAYYESHLEDYMTDFSYDIQEIVLFFDETNRILAETRAKSCLESLNNKSIGFGEAVLQYSESGSKDYNGELQNLRKGDLHPDLENAALALEVGQTSDIIELPGSLHIVRLSGKKEPEPIPFDDVKDKVERILLDPQVEANIRKFVDDLRKTFYLRVDVTPEDL